MPSPDAFVIDWYFPFAFIWGILVFISLAGWGRVWEQLLIPGEKPTWGFAAALGLGTFIIFSGAMLMLSIFSVGFVAIFILAGLVLFVTRSRLSASMSPIAHPPGIGLKMWFVVFCLFLALTYGGGVAMRQYNQNDDFAAYFALTKMALQTGTLFDPFSYRLLGAMGGQLAMNTLVVAFLPMKFTFMLELGIVVLNMSAQVLEMVRGDDSRAWKARLFIATFALTFPFPRSNTASELTGTVFFIALLHTFQLMQTRRCHGWKATLLLGGLSAALATLRCPYIVICAMLCGGFFGWRLWSDKGARKLIIHEAFLTVIFTVLLVAPWWIVTYRSSGAFLYPLFKGTQQPGWILISNQLSAWGTLTFIGTFLLSFNFIPLFLPVYFLRPSRERKMLIILGALIFLISMALLSQLTFGLPSDLYRYVLPLALAFCFFALGTIGRQHVAAIPTDTRRWSGLWVQTGIFLGTIILCLQLAMFTGQLFRDFFRVLWALDARNEMLSTQGPVFDGEANKDYQNALAQIPAGSRVLIALDYPYLLDHQKYAIFSIDQAGAASPAPGFPYFQGPSAVRIYLLSQHFDYIAHVHFDSSMFLHSRKVNEANAISSLPVYRFFSTFELDFEKNVDQLAKAAPVLFDSPNIRVIDLKSGKQP